MKPVPINRYYAPIQEMHAHERARTDASRLTCIYAIVINCSKLRIYDAHSQTLWNSIGNNVNYSKHYVRHAYKHYPVSVIKIRARKLI